MSIDHEKLTDSHKYGTLTGKTPEEIAEENPAAVVRLFERFGTKFCSKALYNDCLSDLNLRRNKDDYI